MDDRKDGQFGKPVQVGTTGRRGGQAGLLVVLAVAVIAMSSSAVLVRWADASPVALAFWRTLGGALVLAPSAMRSPIKPTGRQWIGISVAGVALGIHFGTWLASLELTSVAASVTLVSTAPLLIAAALAISGRPPGPRTWLAIALAVIGTLIITFGDPDGSAPGGGLDLEDPGRATLIGNGLALAGAVTMACYLMTGDRLRATLPTATYAARTYAAAAVTMLVFALLTDVDLVGYDRQTWMAIGAMIIGPQLAGHTALNFLLGQLGSVSVSLALLVEPLGAAILAWLAFRELPPIAAVIGAPLVIGAVALHVLSDERAQIGSSSEPAFDQGGRG